MQWTHATGQYFSVSWNGNNSGKIPTLNCVKQGTVLSFVLFCSYIDKLLEQLKQSKLGYKTGNQYLVTLAYADDSKHYRSPKDDGYLY